MSVYTRVALAAWPLRRDPTGVPQDALIQEYPAGPTEPHIVAATRLGWPGRCSFQPTVGNPPGAALFNRRLQLTLYSPPESEPAPADMPNIDLIDARVTSDLVGHAYFYRNPAASSDLIMLLRYNRGPGAENGQPLKREKNRFWLLTDDYKPSPD